MTLLMTVPFILFVLMLCILVQTCYGVLECFLCSASTTQRIKRLAQGHCTVHIVSIEPAAPSSKV